MDKDDAELREFVINKTITDIKLLDLDSYLRITFSDRSMIEFFAVEDSALNWIMSPVGDK